MEIQKLVLEANGFSSFNPMQEKVLEKEPFDKNVLISAPTASGKTLVAELLALHSVLEKRKMVVYTCPLRALASEHYADFKRKYSKKLGVRVTISTGDFDSSSKYLQNYDIVFTTYEKLDSLIRHKADWLDRIGLLIVDEIHEMDSGRGPTLEMAITKMKIIDPQIQLLGLSATIPNAKEIAQWLDAVLVESDYRPIPLLEGVHYDEKIHFEKGAEQLKGKTALLALLKDTVGEKKKQALVFANTRKRAQGIAKEYAKTMSSFLSESNKKLLEKDAEKILDALEQPTEQCRQLSDLVKQGIAFHHAGLMQKQREAIEQAFKENRIKVISATPTLAMGVNLPAHTVIIPSIYRYASYGMEKIPVREYAQMSGRAGRPKYDTEGRALLLAKTEFELEELFDEYIGGEIEAITSKLGIEPVLRMHLLGLIAGNFVFDLASMEDFFSKTFFAKQYKELEAIFEKLQKILLELEEMEFIRSSDKKFAATPLGKRVAELYLDPLSAYSIIKGLKSGSRFSDISYLFLLANTSEFYPQFSIQKKNEAEVWEKLQASSDSIPVEVEKEMFFDSSLLQKFNSSLVLQEWVNETSEEEMLKQFNIQPGFLFSKTKICDWLCYSAFELAKLLSLEHHLSAIARMRKRIQHGVKEELVILTEVRGIGRVRARKLFKSNVRTISDLKKIDIVDLKKILGEKVAESVKAAVGQKLSSKA